jgi:hypothetical protein
MPANLYPDLVPRSFDTCEELLDGKVAAIHEGMNIQPW